jgi:hypothetical protein
LRPQKLLNQILYVWLSLKGPHPASEVGVQKWVLVAEVERAAHRVVVLPQLPQPVQAFSLHMWLGEDSILLAINTGKLFWVSRLFYNYSINFINHSFM